MYLRLQYSSFHGRERNLKFKPATNNADIDDSLVVLHDGHIGQVVAIHEDTKAMDMVPLLLEEYQPQLRNLEVKLPWDLIGVHR